MELSESSKNVAEKDVEEVDEEEKNSYDGGTGVKDFDGNSRDENNNDAGGGSMEWPKFLILTSQTEALGAKAKAKASS